MTGLLLLQPTLVPSVTRSREFNARFNPLQLTCLRQIFLASDNLVHGRYYADILKVLFCSLAVLDPTVGHTMDVLSPFIFVLSF